MTDCNKSEVKVEEDSIVCPVCDGFGQRLERNFEDASMLHDEPCQLCEQTGKITSARVQELWGYIKRMHQEMSSISSKLGL